MGNGASKDEQLYQAVLNGNTSAVNALRHDGASLEVRIVETLPFYTLLAFVELGYLLILK